jgi:ABC-type transporter Mla subunit MlaD
MKTDRNAFIAGLFMICCFLLAAAVLIGIKGFPGVVVPQQTRQVRFTLLDDVSGLRAGDDVRLGGLRVGNVKSIEVDTASPDGSLLVTIVLPAKYVLHPSATVAVQSSLTGQVCLNIEKLGDGPLLADGQTLTGSPSPISTLLASLQKIGPNVAAITTDVRNQTVPAVDHLVHHLDNKIDPIVDRYNTVADKASTTITEAGSLLGDTKPDFRGTLAHLNVITANIQQRLPTLLDRISGSLASAQSAMQDAKQTLANARVVSASARSLITDNQSKFNAIIDSVRATGENLKAGSVEIRHSPWRLLYKPGPNEMGNVNLYDSARQFADGAESLNDAAGALRDALKDPQTDPKQLQKLMQQLDAAFDNFNQVEQKLWSAVKE